MPLPIVYSSVVLLVSVMIAPFAGAPAKSSAQKQIPQAAVDLLKHVDDGTVYVTPDKSIEFFALSRDEMVLEGVSIVKKDRNGTIFIAIAKKAKIVGEGRFGAVWLFAEEMTIRSGPNTGVFGSKVYQLVPAP